MSRREVIDSETFSHLTRMFAEAVMERDRAIRLCFVLAHEKDGPIDESRVLGMISEVTRVTPDVVERLIGRRPGSPKKKAASRSSPA